MWILQNYKELLEHLKSQAISKVYSIKTFDVSTLYTTILHQQLKSRLSGLIRSSFICQNGSQRYRYIAVKYNTAYFVHETDMTIKYEETDIIRMVEFLIDNISVEFGGHVYQQTVGIPVGTNCAPLVVDLFLYSYEVDFVQHLQKSKFKKPKNIL